MNILRWCIVNLSNILIQDKLKKIGSIQQIIRLMKYFNFQNCFPYKTENISETVEATNLNANDHLRTGI